MNYDYTFLHIYERQFVCNEQHLLHRVFHVLGLSISKTLFSLLVYYIYNLVLRIATEEDAFIPEGKLFHKNTILLKYESPKREVLHKFGRRNRQNWNGLKDEEVG
jgi:hypothetical protein